MSDAVAQQKWQTSPIRITHAPHGLEHWTNKLSIKKMDFYLKVERKYVYCGQLQPANA